VTRVHLALAHSCPGAEPVHVPMRRRRSRPRTRRTCSAPRGWRWNGWRYGRRRSGA